MKSVHAAAAVLITVSGLAHGNDWPMWRHDVGRSGATAHALPTDLQLRWVWNLGRTTPAWPASQTKIQFDAGFEPVCAEGCLVIGSPVDGRVMAIDMTSGEPVWQYFTEGPVRFAPAIDHGRVYAVSDDGYLHCLSLKDGSRLWRVNGGPKRRRIIGNDRLVSMWPVRGGVVVHDGVAYFSAGIWPSMGVFIRAVDARNGEVLWTNSTTGSRFITHPHGADSFGSISPQGYLAVSGDTLLVPGGRTLPAAFDLATGRLRHFEFGGKGAGGFAVLTSGKWYFVGDSVFRASDGASVGQIPARVTGPDRVIGNDGSRIVVTEISGELSEQTETDRRGRKQTRLKLQGRRVAEFQPEGPQQVFIQAGEHVYAAGDGRIAAYGLQGPAADRQPVWSATVDGEIWSMLAADQCLVVTTREGRILCFGTAAASTDQAASGSENGHAEFTLEAFHGSRGPDAAAGVPGVPPETANRSASVPAAVSLQREIPEFTLPFPGYAICSGIPEQPVLEHLLDRTKLHVLILESDGGRAAAFRHRNAHHPEFGRRFWVMTDAWATAALPACLASLMVCSSDSDIDVTDPAALQELVRVLRPYGGTCCLPLSTQEHALLEATLGGTAIAGATVSRTGHWSVLRREGPLPGAGVWSHQYGDASNSVVSTDDRVKPPFGLLWFGGPSNDRVLPRHGHGPAPQVAGGRLFIEGADMLRCVDVYNGRVWWERELPGLGEYYNNTSHHPGAGEIGSNYVSFEDAVYVVYGDQLLELDARTGETVRDFELASGQGTTWGSLLVDGDILFATAVPVEVAEKSDSAPVALPDQSRPVIPRGAEWQYLAGSDPDEDWTQPGFAGRGWKTGRAGFGYGDGDDQTVLKDMPGRYRRVYLRREFNLEPGDLDQLPVLAINFDDAFIAYLNGHEIHRVNVRSGRGPQADSIGSHEAGTPHVITLRDAARWMKPGRNVLAVEGHNTSLNSSDFTLDPWLLMAPHSREGSRPSPTRSTLSESLKPTRYSSSSRLLVAFNRHTGQQLWSRTAAFSFRHNAMCAGNGRFYCIDALSTADQAILRRRGVEPSEPARLMALDAVSGQEVWSTSENVFGTFLNYSREHDVLLQAGSAYRDRAADEAKQGMIAYRGTSGEIVWQDLSVRYGGPCLLRHDRIITNGGGGFELELLSGQRTGWSYQRMYGCNTAIGSEHLLTFRSGAAGFCDLFSDSGTGNLGGFRSSCTSNLVVADGVLNAPDYTRTCVCAYQLQTSLALVHDPENEFWAFGHADFTDGPVHSIGINLGAPGDRRDDDGHLWFDYPVVGGPSPRLDVTVTPESASWFHRHSSLMAEEALNWVGASGVRGARRIQWKLPLPDTATKVSLRLVFSEPDGLSAGERVFSVRVNGREVISDLDVAAEADRSRGTIVRDIDNVEAAGTFDIQLVPKAGSREPVLSGVAVRVR